MKRIQSNLVHNLANIPGWRTSTKIVVIESDDWGSIRMDSKESYTRLLCMGYPVNKHPFNRYDALESNEDLEILFDCLDSIRDKNNNPALITLNFIVANPDFEKIKLSNFIDYHFKIVTDTYSKYSSRDQVIALMKEGILNNMVKPQLHGREHLNTRRWLNALRGRNQALLDAFDNNMFSIHYEENPAYSNEYMDSLDFDHENEISEHAQILKEGYNIFEKIWGFPSKSFIANCYKWHPKHEVILNDLGIKYLQGIPIQFIPTNQKNFKYKRIYHWQGEKNSRGMRYLIRNAFFEPYQRNNIDWVSNCLSRIALAFFWRKPAIISTHRINYIGVLDKNHRDTNIRQLSILLKSIVQKWPDVEFMSSDQLGDLMEQ